MVDCLTLARRERTLVDLDLPSASTAGAMGLEQKDLLIHIPHENEAA
jgi:hypothetical protein